MKKEDLKILYNEIYSVTVEMSNTIEQEDFDKLNVLLSKKDDLIVKIKDANSKIVLTDQEKSELNYIIIPIKELEDKNIQVMLAKQSILKKKIAVTNQGYKVLSSYNIKQEVPPSILDKRE